MEVVRTVASVIGCINRVVDLIYASKKRGGELAAGLDCVKDDLDFIKGRLVEDKELHRQPLMQLKLQELAYDVDDFLHDLWTPKPLGGIALSAFGKDPRAEDTTRISAFKDRAKTLREELDKRSQWTKSDSSSSSSKQQQPLALAAVCSSYALEKDLVGISRPKEEIGDLLSPGDGSLRVISIAGRSGLGKTALARALYQDQKVVNNFDYKAWVVPSSNSSTDILNKILQELVHLEPARWSTVQHFSNKILQLLHLAHAASPHFQKNKRYLVFVDDVQRGTSFNDIQDALRENVMDSRIIITTSVPSIPWECSSGSYVYMMQGLDKEKAKKLLREKFRQKAGYSAQDQYGLGDKDVEIIVDKCDGFPMALISAANILHGKGRNPTTENFNQVSRELGDFLAYSESDFELYRRKNENETTTVEMRRVLVEPYEKLLNNGEKDCLLYVSIFPSGHRINSKSLVRILVAEGLGPGDPHIMKNSEFVVGDAHECLRMLMDQRMIDPVPIRSNCNAAKKCRVHSIMLQFTIKKAVSRNLVSLIHKNNFQYSTAGRVRRLTIQSSSDARCTGNPEKMDLSVLRSLAIFDMLEFHDTGIVNFKNCKLVRVLNLEGCCGLTLEDLENICGLLFLKYLSLRKTDIKELPEKVKNLLCLETLDTRDTEVIKLPVEVIMLPRLAYLFGQFELTNVKKNKKELTKFFSGNKSQLHTLGGIIVDVTQGLEIVLLAIQHAKELKKVKVWYKDTPSSTGTATSTPVARSTTGQIPGDRYLVHTLESNLKKRCINLTDSSMDLESVSIDFNDVPNTFLDFLQTNGTISSIKLRKGLGSMPGRDELGKVSNLKKLHLFSTGLKSEQLASLQYLTCLKYLKLAEDGPELWDSVFHVQVGGFISLIWLCFESSNSLHPPLMIDEGVKIPLASLLLLCEESEGPQTGTPVATIGPQMPIEQAHVVRDISRMPNLNEVILHKEVSDEIVNAWKEEAKKHVNRPYVEKQQV